MMKRIELDIAGDIGWMNDKEEYTDTFDIERINKVVKQEASKYYVKTRCINESGPGGGNPVYEFIGTEVGLRGYLTGVYCAGGAGEDPDFYMESAEDVEDSTLT